jgi:hypothetical protein
MSIAHVFLGLSLLVPLALLSGCIGMRTPLDDASTTIGDGSDSVETTCGIMGIQTAGTIREPVDILLVLDRSESMNKCIDNDCYCDPAHVGWGSSVCSNSSTCTTRWESLISAVTATLSSTTDINWGLKFFSSPNSYNCGVNSVVEVQISSSSASTIQSLIARIVPNYNTPTASAISAATVYLKTVTDKYNKVILLSTDGEPNCAAGHSDDTIDMEGTFTAIAAAATAGFPVYVVGIGPSVGNLDNFAKAGGTGNYYPATSPQAMTDALKSISKVVVTCTFMFSTIPPDIDNIAVYLDKGLVTNSASDGWSLGANSQSVVLNGSYCDKITSGQASTVQVLWGCPDYTPPSTIP